MDDKQLYDVMNYAAIKILNVAIDTLLLHISFGKDPVEALKIFARMKMLIVEEMESRGKNELDREIQAALDKILRDHDEKQGRKGPEKGSPPAKSDEEADHE